MSTKLKKIFHVIKNLIYDFVIQPYEGLIFLAKGFKEHKVKYILLAILFLYIDYIIFWYFFFEN